MADESALLVALREEIAKGREEDEKRHNALLEEMERQRQRPPTASEFKAESRRLMSSDYAAKAAEREAAKGGEAA